MYHFELRVFYGSKIVACEPFQTKNARLAQQLAAQVSTYLARESMPLWMFDRRLVSWAIIEGQAATAVAAR